MPVNIRFRISVNASPNHARETFLNPETCVEGEVQPQQSTEMSEAKGVDGTCKCSDAFMINSIIEEFEDAIKVLFVTELIVPLIIKFVSLRSRLIHLEMPHRIFRQFSRTLN